MSVARLSDQHRLPIGWVLLLLAWISPLMNRTLVQALMTFSLVVFVSAAIGAGGNRVPAGPLRNRPTPELLLMLLTVVTLAGALTIRFMFNRNIDLSGFLSPVSTILLLISTRSAPSPDHGPDHA